MLKNVSIVLTSSCSNKSCLMRNFFKLVEIYKYIVNIQKLWDITNRKLCTFKISKFLVNLQMNFCNFNLKIENKHVWHLLSVV